MSTNLPTDPSLDSSIDLAEENLLGDDLLEDNLPAEQLTGNREDETPTASALASKIEAILYLKAQPLTLATIAEYAGCDRDTAEEALMDLLGDYAHRNTALEIVETDTGYSLQLKDSYQSLVKNLIPVDLGVGAMRTLATIAIRGPLTQTELIDYRGSGAYDQVKDLVERGFVAKRRQANGRSFSLQVTEQFYQYFQLEGIPELKLTAKAQRRRQEQAEATPESAPEAEQLDLPEPAEAELDLNAENDEPTRVEAMAEEEIKSSLEPPQASTPVAEESVVAEASEPGLENAEAAISPEKPAEDIAETPLEIPPETFSEEQNPEP
jgi:segregation and condensation protein B